MNSQGKRSWWRMLTPLATGLCVLLSASGCSILTKDLDNQIAQLNGELTQERTVLAQSAAPYRAIPGKDFQAEIVKDPLMDSISNLLPGGGLISLQSRGFDGKVAEGWTDCPWPFSGQLGAYAKMAFNEAFYAALGLGSLNPVWKGPQPIEFQIQGALGAAGMIVIGGVQLCYVSTDIAPGLAVIVLGGMPVNGRSELTPLPNEGLQYRFISTSPIVFFASIVFPGWYFYVPFWINSMELARGKIPNIVTPTGQVQITQLGRVRHYQISFNFDQADFLANGVRVAGPAVITWID